MAQFASDNFTGTAGTELTAYNSAWTEHSSYTTGQLVLSDANRVRPGANAGCCYYHSGTPFSADYTVSCDLFTKEPDAGSGNSSVAGRIDTASNTMYVAQYLGQATDAFRLLKIVAGTVTQLGSSVTQSLSDETSYNILLRMSGTTIELYKEGSGSASVSVTDSSITSAGLAGLRLFPNTTPSNSVGLHVDNFSADDINLIEPSLFTNTNDFYSATISSAGGSNIDAPLFTNSNTYYTPHLLRSNLTPGLFTNANTFYTHTIAPAGGPTNVDAPYFENAQAFYAAVLSSDVTASLFTNTNSFYAATFGGAATLSEADIDLIWDEDMGDGYSARQLMRLWAAVLTGKVSGAGTGTEIFRAIDDSKDRVTATVDASGNRTAITLDAS